MEKCFECAYKRDILGDAHVGCSRSFADVQRPSLDPYGVKMGWCMWPVNFDPTWISDCGGFSKTIDETKVQSEIAAMASFLFTSASQEKGAISMKAGDLELLKNLAAINSPSSTGINAPVIYDRKELYAAATQGLEYIESLKARVLSLEEALKKIVDDLSTSDAYGELPPSPSKALKIAREALNVPSQGEQGK